MLISHRFCLALFGAVVFADPGVQGVLVGPQLLCGLADRLLTPYRQFDSGFPELGCVFLLWFLLFARLDTLSVSFNFTCGCASGIV